MMPLKERLEREIPAPRMREPASPKNATPVTHVAERAGISLRVIAFLCREDEWSPRVAWEILGKLRSDLRPDG
jgi:hypothetical protein